METFNTKSSSLLCLLSFLFISYSFGFMPPKEMHLSKNSIKKFVKTEDIKYYNILNTVAGNISYTNFSKNDAFYGLEYGIINKDSLSFKFGGGGAKNKDDNGRTFSSFPLYVDVLIGYGFMASIDSYFGIGLTYTFFQDFINKQSAGYLWLGGIVFSLNPQISMFAEYNKNFPSLESLGSEIIKFGLTFKFYPQTFR